MKKAQIIHISKVQIQVENYLFTLFKGRDYATYTDYLDWLKTRAFPENRCGVKELLEKMGLEFYNEIAIAIKTNARMVHDNFSIRIIKDDINAT